MKTRPVSTPRFSRAARILVGLAALLVACERGSSKLAAVETAPPPPPAVVKLDGAKARIGSVLFAPDGASVFVVERRVPTEEGRKGMGPMAVSRRPIGGGAAKELVVSDSVVLVMAPFGDGAVVLSRPSTADERGEPRGPEDSRHDYFDRYFAAIEKTAVYRLVDGAAPARISPEGRRVLHMVSSEDGQYIAYSMAPEGKKRYSPRLDAGAEETRVLNAKTGQEITLPGKGLVRGMSPDGARVLVRRPPKDGNRPQRSVDRESPRDDARSLVMVTVQGQTASDLPTSLQVDGAAVDVATFAVSFAGDGLQLRSPKGEIYRAAPDGSSAVWVAGPLEEGEKDLGDAAEEDEGDEDESPPPERRRRIPGPKGALFELREEGGVIVVGSLARAGAPEPVARLEGSLSSIGAVAFDPTGQRLAISVRSDTSRDGAFDGATDDADVFVTAEKLDPAEPVSFGRAPVALLADELRPKIAAAAGVTESAVTSRSRRGSLEVTAELPVRDGEDAKALVDRIFVAARAISAAAARTAADRWSLHLRVGALDLEVIDRDAGRSPRHIVLAGQGIYVPDPAALTLVHNKPKGITSWGFGGNVVTLSGELLNTGNEATPPIEVFAVGIDGYGEDRKRTRVAKQLGSIGPGESAKYSLTVANYNYGDTPGAGFIAEGKHLYVFNQYSVQHALDSLSAALELRARHGVWFEHRELDFGGLFYLVRLTADHVALADDPREALFKTLMGALAEHRSKYHKDASGVHLVLAAPGGGGWNLEMGKRAVRFEGSAEAQIKERF